MSFLFPARLRRLEWRLPAAIAGLLVAAVVVFTWVAYHTLRDTTLRAAGARVESVTAHLASLLSASIAEFGGQSTQISADPRLAEALRSGSPEARERARQYLDSLARGSAQIAGVELVDADGRAILDVASPGRPADPPAEPAFTTEGPGPRVSGFQAAGESLWYAMAVPVPSGGEAAGTLLYHFVLTDSGDDADGIARLIGAGAALRLGVPGGLWIDLSRAVEAPPSHVADRGPATRYTLASGEDVLGAGAPIAGTPWFARVELDESAVLAPAREFLGIMLPVGAGIVALGALVGWMLGRRITGPLSRLTEGATAMASGDYRRPVPERGADELVEVARAFNSMAVEIAGARDHLESMVEARTAALKQSEERFRNLATVAPDAIVTADHQGRITYVNPGAERIFGYPAHDVIGGPLARLLPERFRDGSDGNGLRPALRDAAPTAGRTLELTARHADGAEFPIELSVATDEHAGGPAFIGLIRDITQRKSAEQRLEHYAASLEAANGELEAFSYSVSHDLRAPLRAIHGFSLAVLEGHGAELPAQGQDDLRRVCAAADHMSRLIDDLLELSRATRTEMRLESLDLSALARDINEELAAREPDRSVDVRIEPGLGARGDRRLLDHVLRNLLENAWKFTSKKAHATIEVGRATTNDRAFFVRDDGAGFDPEYIDKLFGPFQRLHSPRDFPGSGVGLALVARIVHRHGGRVRAEGAIDQGATFSFTLPGT